MTADRRSLLTPLRGNAARASDCNLSGKLRSLALRVINSLRAALYSRLPSDNLYGAAADGMSFSKFWEAYMKRAMLGTGLFFLSFFVSTGAWAETPALNGLSVYDGKITIVSVTAPCLESGDKVGDSFKLVFRSLPNPFNGRAGGLQMMFGTGGHIFMMRDGKPLPGGRQKGKFDQYHVSGSVGFSGPVAAPFDLTISPPTIGETTPAVTISGKIMNFHLQRGCEVVVRGSGKLRP